MKLDSLATINQRIFDHRFAWSDIDRALALQNRSTLDLIREACLIESYFAIYMGKMVELFWYDIQATSMFTIESMEAYAHYYCLRRYLDIINYRPVDDDELRQLRANAKDQKLATEIAELVNFMATELFAAAHFRTLSSQTTEPVLAHMLAQFAQEEVTHAHFAADLLKTRLAANQTARSEILRCAKEFQHIGAYVLSHVSDAGHDNLGAITAFNRMIFEITGESISTYRFRTILYD